LTQNKALKRPIFVEEGLVCQQGVFLENRCPERVSGVFCTTKADQIDRTRNNRSWCKVRGIQVSAPLLSRLKQDQSVQAQLRQQARQDEKV
jgi:hypothetical protein